MITADIFFLLWEFPKPRASFYIIMGEMSFPVETIIGKKFCTPNSNFPWKKLYHIKNSKNDFQIQGRKCTPEKKEQLLSTDSHSQRKNEILRQDQDDLL
jgi:hypothetical protein